MNGRDSARREKTPVGFWVLTGICAALTVALLAYIVVYLVNPVPAAAGEDPEDREEVYSEEERWEYWRGFDAAALAAAVCDAYPDADGCTMAEGEDENFLSMTVEADGAEITPHFSLRGANMTFHGGYPGYNRGFVYTTRLYADVEAPWELAESYGDHLEELGARVVKVLKSDMDGDGETEYVYLVQDMIEQWLDASDGSAGELAACEPMRGKTVCVYLDAGEESLGVHGFCLPEDVAQVSEAVWDNGMLHLLYEKDGQEAVCRLNVSEEALCLPGYDGDPDALKRICTRYATYLEDQGYTDVRMRLADVSAAPGQEVLCCYSDGTDYTVKVFAAYYGQLRELFGKSGVQGSVYLVRRNGGEYLFDYSQNLSDADYSQSYSYCLFRFDESYSRLVEDADTLQVAANQGGGQAGSEFFGKVNDYLSDSDVCYDPYALTGYKVMQESSMDSDLLPEGLYLRISNCSTNKVGVVTLQDDDSWLNFRSGPSTAYDMLLINPGDPESCVKQVQGSIVTVLMPYNTGDRNNPIWCQIQISYQNRTMEGYSSQRYIRINGITHLNPGDSFTVTADTNDGMLYWSCSDTSVARIDSETGTLTAYKSGLVLITVTSANGLEDSCLIMVD